MIKYFLALIALIGFIGCSSSSSSSSDNRCSLNNLYTSPAPSSIPMVVVLINYNDINITSAELDWTNKIFGNSDGQLNHYINEISNSQFTFTIPSELSGVISVNLDKNHPNVAINNPFIDFSSAVHPDFKSALIAIDSSIDFSSYDTNNDNHIQASELLITFIMAGYEDAYEGFHVNQGIWAHQSCTDVSNTPMLDGVTLMGCSNYGNYAVFGERHDINPTPPNVTHDATIGIIAHELGHSAFSLPDLYLGNGIGYFGLMGAGMWAFKDNTEDAGQTPVHMSAWSKYFKGWTNPDNTIGSKILYATSSPSYNTLIIENNDKCYFLENRDNSGYDRGLILLNPSGTFNGGIAIWEIDETKTTQSNIEFNNVNSDYSHQGVYMIDAQGTYVQTIPGDESALFYNENVASFITFNTSVSNISSRGPTMTLNVN